MPRRKRAVSPTNYDLTDDEFDDECGSNRNLPGQRNAANARERARMRILSSAFCRLKTKLPWVPPDTKLSKLDTLKLATTYIQQLGALLAGETEMVDNSMPQNLTWPFHFQQPPDQTKINPGERSSTSNSKNTLTTLPSPSSTSSSSSSSISMGTTTAAGSPMNAMDTAVALLSPNTTSQNSQSSGLNSLNIDSQWLAGHQTAVNHNHHHHHHPLHSSHHQHHLSHHHQHLHHQHHNQHQTTLLTDCNNLNFRETNSSCFNSILHGQ